MGCCKFGPRSDELDSWLMLLKELFRLKLGGYLFPVPVPDPVAAPPLAVLVDALLLLLKLLTLLLLRWI